MDQVGEVILTNTSMDELKYRVGWPLYIYVHNGDTVTQKGYVYSILYNTEDFCWKALKSHLHLILTLKAMINILFLLILKSTIGTNLYIDKWRV